MWHEVHTTRTPAPPDGELESGATEWTRLTWGNCARRLAVDCAQNAIRFGSWARAHVFAGKDIGRLVYAVHLDDSPEPGA